VITSLADGDKQPACSNRSAAGQTRCVLSIYGARAHTHTHTQTLTVGHGNADGSTDTHTVVRSTAAAVTRSLRRRTENRVGDDGVTRADPAAAAADVATRCPGYAMLTFVAVGGGSVCGR